MAKQSFELFHPISSRGCALLIKSICVFRSVTRDLKDTTLSVNNSSKRSLKRRKMASQDSKCPSRIYEVAKHSTCFSKNEIDALYHVYRKLISISRPISASENTPGVASTSIMRKTVMRQGLDRNIFRELLHNTFNLLTEDTLMDRIFCVWDKNNAGLLTVDAWFWGLQVFLKGTKSDKLEFCFQVYDLNADGYISKEEMFQLLKNCLIKHPQDEDPDEGIKDLVELIMKKMDVDKDGKVSLQDYQTTVDEEPLLLEAFGKCLPDERACDTFLSTMKA